MAESLQANPAIRIILRYRVLNFVQTWPIRAKLSTNKNTDKGLLLRKYPQITDVFKIIHLPIFNMVIDTMLSNLSIYWFQISYLKLSSLVFNSNVSSATFLCLRKHVNKINFDWTKKIHCTKRENRIWKKIDIHTNDKHWRCANFNRILQIITQDTMILKWLACLCVWS